MTFSKLDIIFASLVLALVLSIGLNGCLLSKHSLLSKSDNELEADAKKQLASADSANTQALYHEHRADSLEKITLKMDSNNIRIVNQYEKDKNKVASLTTDGRRHMADSIVSSRLRLAKR